MSEVKDFVFIFDNLGDDVEISQESLLKLKKFVLEFQSKWNRQSLKDIREDVLSYMKFTSMFPMEKFIEQEEEILNRISDFDKELDVRLQKVTQDYAENSSADE